MDEQASRPCVSECYGAARKAAQGKHSPASSTLRETLMGSPTLLMKNVCSLRSRMSNLAVMLAIAHECWYSSFVPEETDGRKLDAMAKPTLLPDPTYLHLQLLDASG